MTTSHPQPAIDHSQSAWTLTARWVFPVDQPPLERGVVTIQGEKIAAVEPHGTRTADIDLGNAAILPGLVNAHTHLDLSGLRGKCPPTPDFTEWLRGVIRHRRGQTPEQVEADTRVGLAESLASGTTLLGDISADGRSWEAVSFVPIRGVIYYELLGLPHARALAALARGRNWLHAHLSTETCRQGWSPHAPYSLAHWAIENAGLGYGPHRPAVSIHLAETRSEKMLLEMKSGPFVEFLTELDVWDPDELVRDWLEVIKLLTPSRVVTFVHANYLSPDVPIPGHGTIIYCPRTHAAFGHPPHPFREFLARGVRVALGTDSLASNPDLDILAEARFVHGKYPDFPGDTLLRMITLSGAEALGWADETGSLSPGKSADLVVLPLPQRQAADPHFLVLDSDLRVEKTLFRGQWRS